MEGGRSRWMRYSRLEGGQVDGVGRVVTVLEIITRHLGRGKVRKVMGGIDSDSGHWTGKGDGQG